MCDGSFLSGLCNMPHGSVPVSDRTGVWRVFLCVRRALAAAQLLHGDEASFAFLVRQCEAQRVQSTAYRTGYRTHSHRAHKVQSTRYTLHAVNSHTVNARSTRNAPYTVTSTCTVDSPQCAEYFGQSGTVRSAQHFVRIRQRGSWSVTRASLHATSHSA